MRLFLSILFLVSLFSTVLTRHCGPHYVSNIVKDICKYQGTGTYSYEALLEANALSMCCRRKCSVDFLKKFCR